MILNTTSERLKDRYQIIRELGSGGFGKTYLAEDTQMPSKRKCVIKRLKVINDNPQMYKLIQERFEREAILLEKLGNQHSQIPSLYAYFSENERFYLVEEWIQGQTLDAKIKCDGVMSEKAVKELLLSLLSVLQFVQTKGIIHRDIKPENIILRPNNGFELPILIDFGLVKETMATRITTSGNIVQNDLVQSPNQSYPTEAQTPEPSSDSPPDISDSPSSSTPPTQDNIDTPPMVNIGGRSERATQPISNINGYWRLDFSVGPVNHQSILYMNGARGEMLTRYFDQQANKTQQVVQTMRLWSSSVGLIVKGYNPVYLDTKQAAFYNPDEILLLQKPDGSIYAENCSGGVCSNVRFEYIGTTLDQNQDSTDDNE
jgi:serine/threonine protein kinase